MPITGPRRPSGAANPGRALKPNAHRRRRRDSTRQSAVCIGHQSRVIGQVIWARCRLVVAPNLLQSWSHAVDALDAATDSLARIRRISDDRPTTLTLARHIFLSTNPLHHIGRLTLEIFRPTFEYNIQIHLFTQKFVHKSHYVALSKTSKRTALTDALYKHFDML